MKLSIIAAMDRNRLIGKGERLPWKLPADLHHFKRLTVGKPIVMGRKTYESIGRPLPDRTNIVVSRDPDFKAGNCQVVSSLESALKAVGGAAEVMIIGGNDLFRCAMPQTHRLYLTFIDAEFEGDTWFPKYRAGDWREVSREEHKPDDENPFPYFFVVLDRK